MTPSDKANARNILVVIMGAAFLLMVFLLGGSVRADVEGQMIIRIASIITAAVALLLISRQELARVRVPLLILGALAILTLVQLVPLPPALWSRLPGRDFFIQAAALAGVPQPWRTISLVPDATLNSALATLPGFAVLLMFALMRREQHFAILLAIAGLSLLSGVIGLIQLSGYDLYFYEITNRGSGVGVFANRNHQAALLAATFPLLAAIAAYPVAASLGGLRVAIALLVALFLVVLELATGSRAGLILMIVGIGGAYLLWRSVSRGSQADVAMGVSMVLGWSRRRTNALIIGFALAVIAATVVLFSRSLAVNRLFLQDVEGDARLRLFATMSDIVVRYFPFGTGFGSFPTIFKRFEPEWYLGPAYFNHAHNDVMEIIIEGGIFSVILALAFLGWWGRAAVSLWRQQNGSDRRLLLGRLGTLQTLILLLASFADYPLRTPLCQTLFILGAVFMAYANGGIDRERAARRSFSPSVNHGTEMAELGRP